MGAMSVVLVIEADEVLSEFICECLRTPTLEPVPCSAEKAAALALELRADAAVLALSGAQLDKTPLYRALRDDPRTAWIPLILCTGRGNATVSRRLGEKPPYLVFKPFDPAFLLKVVELAIKENPKSSA